MSGSHEDYMRIELQVPKSSLSIVHTEIMILFSLSRGMEL